MSHFFKGIAQSDICAGCGLCQSISNDSVRVELNSEGFYRPRVVEGVSEAAIEQIRQVCPAVTVQHTRDSGKVDPIWGPVQAIRTGYATDEAIRYRGSSGGVLTALQTYLLEQDLVDAVVSVGASAEAPLLNKAFLSRTKDELLSHAGSRYAPSAPLSNIHKLLHGIDQVVFVGKPCDVSALRRLVTCDASLGAKKIYFLSFLCAGVPSQHATGHLVEALGFKAEEVKRFRYRGNGWPGYATAEANDGRTAKMSYNDSWGKILNRHLQTRCKICPDGTGEFADIACGDAWHGGSKGYPDFEERDGRSAILIRTNQGQELFEGAVAAGYLKVEAGSFSLTDLSEMQPYQVNRRQMFIPRSIAFFMLRSRRIRSNCQADLAAFKMASLRRGVREFLGTMRRLILQAL